jgi:hypothetical protein
VVEAIAYLFLLFSLCAESTFLVKTVTDITMAEDVCDLFSLSTNVIWAFD